MFTLCGLLSLREPPLKVLCTYRKVSINTEMLLAAMYVYTLIACHNRVIVGERVKGTL